MWLLRPIKARQGKKVNLGSRNKKDGHFFTERPGLARSEFLHVVVPSGLALALLESGPGRRQVPHVTNIQDSSQFGNHATAC